MWNTFVEKFIEQEGYKLTLTGLTNTALIAVFGLLIGFLLGSIIAVVKLVPAKNVLFNILKKLCDGYVAIFRGTPIVVQLLLLHFAVFPALGLLLEDVVEASLIFGLNSAAYISEIMRGGINSVDKGQMEAGRSLGFGYTTTMIKIIIPQAFKNILPTLGNEFISLIKETSVLSLIAVTDLTKSFKAIAESTYEYFIPYIMLAVTYFVIVYIISLLVKFMERRLNTDAKK
ncbi:MAG: amino acid ABC transporter permease [Clostridiales bacterium]|nr:amino acid ABC transporter permease [Clostridiales bacterium]